MKTLLLALALLVAADTRAQSSSPEELVRKVTAEVLEAIKADPQLQGGDRKKALALAEQRVLPHVDFREAAQLAAGRSWAIATPEQRDRLVAEFRAMLVRVYSRAIDVYRGQTMKVLPVRIPPGATEATVRNQYLSDGKQPVAVSYAMRQTPAGWKIYDINIEGVSLVLTYRSEFEAIVRSDGVEGLIRKLQEKNA